MQRIGVFVCHCGTNIAATVDVKAVVEALSHEPGVVFATEYQYMCSESGQTLMREAIREHKLGGVVVCSCSPRMHEATFRKAAAKEGLNPYMVEKGQIDKLAASDSIYRCLSCFACMERCPRQVEPAKLIEAVRLHVVRAKGANHLKPEQIPAMLDEDLPQQAIASAFRKYSK